ncbi:hypothetical protein [Sulfobacillus harzensis]|uniref:Uncharacterized protein n=1 Tax=Sulfobacillus harzensis TaxID=2729629 RepID=A0A7Y0L2L5_9FIRM|nr:hypothetical protein [Sulfobacillus harzensis]NMP22060.1 hypothetical protein [Sulfobacillus harzensis]
MQHQTLMPGVPLFRVQPEGAESQALQGLGNVLPRLLPIATGRTDFRREIGQGGL